MNDPLVFEHGPAAIAFEITVGAWVVFEGVMQVRQRLLRWGRAGFDWSAMALAASIGPAVVAAVRLGHSGPLAWPGGRVWPVVVGLVMLACGVLLRAWSIATLGRFFQYRIVVQSDHEVVTGGPYRYVRHPSYSGLLLALTGIAFATGDVLSPVAAASIASVGLAVRINAEERQLVKALGPEYERFAAARRRIIPGVW